MSTTIRFCVLIAAIAFSTALAAATPSTQDDAKGVAAARRGDFESALRYFAAARQAGNRTPTLTYNIGVANFKLGRLDAARAAFAELTGDPRWRALAYYNLGLIDTRAGRHQAAQAHYRQARDYARQPKLRALAQARIHPAAPNALEPAWHGLASASGGYDDNVILADDRLVASASGSSDNFAEVLAAARRPLTGDDRRGLTLDLAGYYRAHVDLNDFDFGVISATGLWHRPAAEWEFSTGGRVESQFAGGKSYANVLTYRLQMERGLGSLSWLARNDVSYVAAASRFDYVNGWRNRTRVQLSSHLPQGTLGLGYDLELNDRDDLTANPEFFSYSPLRQRLFGSVDLELKPRLTLETAAALRLSKYPDDNRFLDTTGALVSAPRDQHVVTLDVRLDYQLGERLTLWSSYQYLTSDSDIPRYRYSSNRYRLGLEALF